MGRIKNILDKKERSDALVSRETLMREFRVQLTGLVKEIQEAYSLSEGQAVSLLIDLFKRHKPGEFMEKHVDKPKS